MWKLRDLPGLVCPNEKPWRSVLVAAYPPVGATIDRGRLLPDSGAFLMRDLDDLFAALSRSEFRRRFRLRQRERDYLQREGLPRIMDHARRFIVERLAPAVPKSDGRQTPMQNHPVFVAQHATATCCRGCLAKWHNIPAGKALNQQEIDYALRVIERWIAAQGIEESPSRPEGQLGLF